MDNLWMLFAAAGVMVAVIGGLSLLGDHYTLNNIKSKTVGDGQHGTARWATDAELRKTYALVPFQVPDWRAGKNLPEAQGLVLGSISGKHGITALVDKDDVHCLMIGASGVGKTAYFLYPNLEYACASGMSFLALDTKGDLARNYGAVAEKYYGYHVSVVDLRNPTRSDGYNLMTLINRYMDTSFHEHTIFGGFAPNSQTAEQLSKSLGSRTVLSGSVSKGKTDPSQSLQMIERPLMTPDELKSIPKGSFVVMKTGTHPMQTKLRLFLDWGITFGEPYATPEHAARPVAYASRQELFLSISKRYGKSSDQPAQAQQASATQRKAPRSAMGLYSEDTRP